MEQITDPQKLAAVIHEIVEKDDRWYQGNYYSYDWKCQPFTNNNDENDPFCSWEFPVQSARDTLDNECGSTACVAGWAGILSSPLGTFINARDWLRLPDGNHAFIGDYARNALGLTSKQANYLFSGFRSKEQVLCALAEIASGHPENVPSEE